MRAMDSISGHFGGFKMLFKSWETLLHPRLVKTFTNPSNCQKVHCYKFERKAVLSYDKLTFWRYIVFIGQHRYIITSTHPLKKQENTTITSLPWLNFGGISVMHHGSWRGGLSFSTFQVEVTVNSWSVSVLNINKVTQKSGYICQHFFIFIFYFFYSVVVAWGSLWTVDQQLSLSDKLPAREKEREQKKDEWNKEQANSAVWLRRAPFHSKKQAEEGGGRSQQNGNGRVLVGGRG